MRMKRRGSCIFRGAVGGVVLAFLCLPISVSAQTSGKFLQARKHLAQAEEYRATSDPRAEQEYRAAVASAKGRYADASLAFSTWLAENLRFDEAAAEFEKYLSESGSQNQDEHNYLAELKEAARLALLGKNESQLTLHDMLKYAQLVGRYSVRKREAAIPILRKAIERYPDSAQARILLAMSLPTARSTESIEMLREARRIDPNNAEASLRLGGFLLYESPALAEMEFREALRLSQGRLSIAWDGLGQSLMLQGKDTEAIEAFREYLRCGDVPSHYRSEVQQRIERLQK